MKAKGSYRVDNYVVRVYRRGSGARAQIAGVVEDPLRQTEMAFRNIDELQRILSRARRSCRRAPVSGD